MATYKSNAVQDYRPAPIADGSGEMKVVRGQIDLAVQGGGALAVNDLLEMVKLPAQHILVDAIIDSTDLDTGGSPAIALSAGLISGTAAEIIAANAVGQAGGIARMDAVAGLQLAKSDSDQVLGLKVTTGPATGAATGIVGLTVMYRAVGQDD